MDAGAVLADAGVSEREAEVLDLLGDHLTHAQIGSRLFISVRTVESHVASLRRKLGMGDHRSLVQFAVRRRAGAVEGARGRPAPCVPTQLTSFVGRVSERRALAAALAASRLVTAVGPGGVGKTRLAIAVAQDVADCFPDGIWYVDLVPVTDPVMVAPAVNTVLGVVEQAGQSSEDALALGIADRQSLIVLDNCEHLIDRVAVLTERLLSACARVVVLATSRTRMVVPFERVYQVPGLSLPDGSAEVVDRGDAVALFLERAAAAGNLTPGPGELHRVAAICRALDGSALAIELAAARLSALGLAGLEQGVADQLALLTGGRRLQPRHRSVQETLDWSYRLLDPVDRAVLRRVSVFASPFDTGAATSVAAFTGVAAADLTGALARLADHSLLVPVGAADGTRYRALETIRQYGATQLEATDEQDVLARHLRWCLVTAAEIDSDTRRDPDDWPVVFDAVVDDLRAALGWSARQAEHRTDAYELAHVLARLLFLRGRPGEAQRRYEQAAGLAEDGRTSALAFARAAAVAKCRVVGDEALRLDRAAAEAALMAGDTATAAVAFARSAELTVRFRGMFAELPPPGSVEALLAAARRHAHGDLWAEAAIVVAEANNVDAADPKAGELVERAIGLAHRTGDLLLESAALDALLLVQIMRGDIVDAAATGRHRVELLAPLALEPETAFGLKDALHSAVFTSLGAGDLPGARRLAEQHLALPFLREEGHLANEELLLHDALAGDWARVLTVSEQFRASWNLAGRPCSPGRGMPPSAVAMVHGLRGDDIARADWLVILAAVRGVLVQHAGRGSGYGEVFDALVALHRGRPEEALRMLATEPEAVQWWYGQIFRQWYLALRSEAAVLAGRPDAGELIATAEVAAARNPLAAALVQRAGALMTGDRTALLATADMFDNAGCRYQMARTLVLAGGQASAIGRAALAEMGAAAMFV